MLVNVGKCYLYLTLAYFLYAPTKFTQCPSILTILPSECPSTFPTQTHISYTNPLLLLSAL